MCLDARYPSLKMRERRQEFTRSRSTPQDWLAVSACIGCKQERMYRGANCCWSISSSFGKGRLKARDPRAATRLQQHRWDTSQSTSSTFAWQLTRIPTSTSKCTRDGQACAANFFQRITPEVMKLNLRSACAFSVRFAPAEFQS